VSTLRDVQLGDERGQSLVFFVLLLFGLVLILVLVVNVGAWLRAQRQAQAVADAVALAVVQELPSSDLQSVADSYANQNWAGFTSAGAVALSSAGSSPGSAAIAVRVSHPVPGFFGSLTGIFSVTVRAHATARVQAPTALTAVVPLSLECGGGCASWPLDESVTFTWSSKRSAANTFSPLRLPGVNTDNFGTYIGCDARDPTAGNCSKSKVTVGTYRELTIDVDSLGAALEAAGGAPHLVAVYDSLSRGARNRRVHVIGWAAFTTENVVENTSNSSISLTGHFDKFFVDSSFLASNGVGDKADFGVRAVGLIG
jgi:Flp pilus assembly protein TadG